MPDNKRQNRRGTGAVNNIETAASELGRRPPQALDLERSVLGAMMLEPSCLDDIVGRLQPNCFYDPRMRKVFEAVAALYRENNPVDMLSVVERMKSDGTLEMAGGPAFIADLVSDVAAASHVEYHAAILQQKAIQRNLIDASYAVLRDAFDETVSLDSLIGDSQSRIYEAVSSNIRNDYRHVGDVVNRSLEIIEKVQSEGVSPGIPSGFPSLDAFTSGWKPSNLIIVGARPSVGKTAFALNLARAAAVQFGVPVGFFTLEMHDTEITDRLICAETGISSDHLHGNSGYKLSQDEWKRIETSIVNLVKAPIYIDETPSLPIMEFMTKAKRMKREHNVGLIIIDYLQLMTGTPATAAHREQEVSSISRLLKATAKELNIPIIALAQLNRNIANRAGSNGRPMLSDLRESGSIEQDADMVLFVHRPFMLGIQGEFCDDPAYTEIIVAKNRSGKTGHVKLRYVGEEFRFKEEDTTDYSYFDSALNRTPPQEVPQVEPAPYDPFQDNRFPIQEGWE